jgi:hypothetical protein
VAQTEVYQVSPERSAVATVSRLALSDPDARGGVGGPPSLGVPVAERARYRVPAAGNIRPAPGQGTGGIDRGCARRAVGPGPAGRPERHHERQPGLGELAAEPVLVAVGAVGGHRAPYRSTVVVMDAWPSQRETAEIRTPTARAAPLIPWSLWARIMLRALLVVGVGAGTYVVVDGAVGGVDVGAVGGVDVGAVGGVDVGAVGGVDVGAVGGVDVGLVGGVDVGAVGGVDVGLVGGVDVGAEVFGDPAFLLGLGDDFAELRLAAGDVAPAGAFATVETGVSHDTV